MHRTALHIGVAWVAALLLWHGAHAANTITRVTASEYEPGSRLPVKTMVEPGDSRLCLVKVFTLDAHGNRTGTTTRNCNASIGSAAPHNSEAAAPAAGDPAAFAPRIESAAFSDPRFQTSQVDAAGQAQSQAFNGAFGVPASSKDVNNLATTWTVDEFGRKTREVRPDGTGTTWAYAWCSTLPGGTQACPSVGGVQGAYVIIETPVLVSNSAQIGPVTKTYHDGLNRPIRIETEGFDAGGTPRAIYQDTEYNLRGLPSRKSRPYFAGDAAYWTQFTYDAKDRLTLTQAPDGGTTVTAFNGLSVAVTDALAHTVTTVHNVAGWPATVTNHLNQTLTNSHNAFGELVSVVDPLGNKFYTTRDNRGRVTSTADPDRGEQTYAYNAAGDLVQETNGRGDSTTRTVDAVGRVTTSRSAAFTGNWYFGRYADATPCANGVGKLCEVVSGNGAKSRVVYDAAGRLSTVTETIAGGTYQASLGYDAKTGRLSTVAYPRSGLQVRNNYTTRGYLQSVVNGADGQPYWTATAQDAEQHVIRHTLGNAAPGNASVAVASSYDPATGRLLSRTAGASNGVQNLVLAFDRAGNLVSRKDLVTGVAATYGYDGLNRLTSELRQGGGLATAQSINWTYDAIGNIRSRSDVGSFAYPPGGASSAWPHAVSGVAGTVNGVANPVYAYDPQGNLTQGGGRTIRWDAIDGHALPTRIDRGAATLTYLYAADKHRVKEDHAVSGALAKSTVYVHPAVLGGLLYEAESVGLSTRQRHYITAGGEPVAVAVLNGSTWSTEYWFKDHLGSIDVVTNQAGTVVERLAYEPFGKRRNANGTTDAAGSLVASTASRGFTGHEQLDEVGLVHMNGRVFDPAIGRFLSADPFVQAPADLQSYNRYSYVANNPLSLTDPTGYESSELIASETLLPLPMPAQSVVRIDNAKPRLGLDSGTPQPAVSGQATVATSWLSRAADAVGDWAKGEVGQMKADFKYTLNNPLQTLENALAPMPDGGQVLAAFHGLVKVAKATEAEIAAARAASGMRSTAKVTTTSLFRAVGPAELADIKATRALRNLGSAEGKYFTTSAAEASAYAKQAVKAFGDQPYTIIRTEVPNTILKGLSPATVDRGIPAWVIPTDRLPGLVPNVLNHSTLPPVGF